MQRFIRTLGLSLMFIGVFKTSQGAWALAPQLLAHPDPARAAYYHANASSIDELEGMVKDTARPVAQRTTALETLAVRFHDAAVITAIQVVRDPSVEVASAALELLAASIVMSDHRRHDMDHLTPLQQFLMQQHTETRKALRIALADTRPNVRSIAAVSLASLSDEDALKLLQAGVEKGLYTEDEAVNYFGLADPDVGASYIMPYLQRGPTAMQAAVGYLGANRQYQALVRDKVFLNLQAPPETRAAAAKVLSQYDSAFSSYALTVTLDPKTPPNVYTEVLDGYLTQSQAKGQINPAQISVLKEALKNYRAIRPGVDLQAIEKRLDALQ
jgi:hypothetical protein